MTSEIINNTTFYNSTIFATIIGGLIGIFGSLLIFFCNIWWTNHIDKIKNKKNYLSWLKGMEAEINHLVNVLTELDGILEKGNITTKRLNYDYIQSSRFKIIEFENDINFLEILTNAYRDIEHTNGMLDRLEYTFKPGDPFINNVIASLKGVRASIKKLKEKLDIKLKEIEN